MNDNDRIRRSNRILIAIVVLFLLYGVITRIQSGDTSLYIFGYKIDLPFTRQQTVEETVETEEETAETEDDAAVSK